MTAQIRFLCFVLVSITACFSVHHDIQAAENTPTGFDWLKQFEGNWAVLSTSKAVGSHPAMTTKGNIESKPLGKSWIVNEHSGDLGGMTFNAVQTITYDTDTKQFSGSWIDSISSFKWKYSGNLSETGKRLILNAEGPDWTSPDKMRQYRDIYEFKSTNEIAGSSEMLNDDGEWESFMTSTITRIAKPNASPVTPFLMFTGQAQEAIKFYQSVFPRTKVDSIEKYGADEIGIEGTVKVATFTVEGQPIKCTDSPIKHDFDFTPSFSFFVECEDEQQLESRFKILSDGGKVMMPIDNYGFSQKFAWVSDKFGVSWQLNLQ